MRRKILTGFLTLVMLVSALGMTMISTNAAELTNSRIVGDANNDSKFNVADLVRTKRY